MTDDTPWYQDTDALNAAAAVGLLALVVALAAIALSAPGAVAAANNTTLNETAPYYENASTGGSGLLVGWYANDTFTLHSGFDLAARMPGVVVGTGQLDQSGTGYVGVLLTGLAMAAATFTAVLGTGVGPIGGTILGLAVGYGLIGAGLAPGWMQPLLLFAVGIAVSLAIRRTLQ